MRNFNVSILFTIAIVALGYNSVLGVSALIALLKLIRARNF